MPSELVNWLLSDAKVLDPKELGRRTIAIAAHYDREIVKGRMTLMSAKLRAKHDIAGNNGHKSLPQRSNGHTQTIPDELSMSMQVRKPNSSEEV